jgi:6,7-dimethyl-8-ribityllumazine synthase
VPISFGVITADTYEQAVARAGGEVGNKGAEAVAAALEVAAVLAGARAT